MQNREKYAKGLVIITLRIYSIDYLNKPILEFIEIFSFIATKSHID
jgi:hypothetical protein